MSYLLKLLPAGSASLSCPTDPSDGLGEDPVRVGDILSRLVVITVSDGDDDSETTLVAGVCLPQSAAHIPDHIGGVGVDRDASATPDGSMA